MRRAFAFSVSMMLGLLACGGEVENERGRPPSTLCGVGANCSRGEESSGAESSKSEGWTEGPSDPPPTGTQVLGCDPGHFEVASIDLCEEGDACYGRTSSEGRTIVCSGANGLCEEPDCPSYWGRVDDCAHRTACGEHRVCGTTLLCEYTNSQCDGIPNCDGSDEQVESAEVCALEKDRCYARTYCNMRIYCLRDVEQPDP